ncbi:MAG: 2-oxo-4-hydroxy-4-carboxy-5-ureidoimidazoline decarboxylase [Hyphomonadaceae bacterium]|nr:2-oxo-4-hydroxy-4-carboxy-5-ureidoimidazoline decarboxylase [Hyphomonadaceae bacterium]
MTKDPIAKINALDRTAFVALLGPLYEHSPWAAERAFASAPFASDKRLSAALTAAVNAASETERIALIRAHPELAGEKLRAKTLTDSSQSEQASIGLDRLSDAEIADWTRLNATYRERFGFPFVICVRLHTKPEIIAALHRRLDRSRMEELSESIAQIHDIARLRLSDVLTRLEAQP